MIDPEDWPRLWFDHIIKPITILLLLVILAVVALAFYAGTQI